MNAAQLQNFLDQGGGDAGGSDVTLTSPLLIPTRSRLLNCTLRGVGIPFALVAGDDSTPLTGLHVADVEVYEAGVHLQWCGDSFVDRVRIYRPPDVGLKIVRGYEVHVRGVKVRDGQGVGILIDGVGNDQYLSECRVVGGTAGVELRQTGGVWLDTVGTSFCGTGFLIGHGSQQVEFLFSTRCSADEGPGHGYRIGPKARCLRFSQDWASSNALNGVLVEGAADVNFSQMRLFNNILHGMQLTGSDFGVEGCCFSGNGSGNSPNFHGLTLGNVQGARLVGNRGGQVAHFGASQGYGLYVASSFSKDIVCVGNDWRANVTGGRYFAPGAQVVECGNVP